MMRAAIALACLRSTALLAHASTAQEAARSPARSGTTAPPAQAQPRQDHSLRDAVQDQTLLPGARDVADRILTFLSNANSTADLAVANIDKHMGVTLGPDLDNGDGWSVYRSPDFGQGWIYGVQYAEFKPPLKPMFRFWFYHPDPDVPAAPVCALSLDALRSKLTSHGWVERPVLSEIGSVLAIEFANHELRLTLTPRDVVFSGDTKCVLLLQVSGGY